ncbi:mitochondrial ATP synthase g subunit-domain-containing protein [Lanmaoa asiatica]|nr:mitochondrial ATP synthase g subunit-domain-containing protein [Lanmaoa asiatica]
MGSTFSTSLFRQAVSRRASPSFAARRFASTQGASSSKQVQDALGVAQRLLSSAGQVLGPLGERAAGLLGSYRQPLIYNAEVARELLKQIYIAERLQPPTSLATITDAYSVLWGRAKNPQYWRDLLTTGEWAPVALYAVEAYAIFKVGEIIGRRHLIGYKLH